MAATKKKIALLLALFLLLTACSAFESPPVSAPSAPVDLPVLTSNAAAPAETAKAEPASIAEPESVPEASPPSESETVPDSIPDETAPESEDPEDAPLPEDGTYTSKDEVALYIHQYGHLPDNFITKKEAEALGWPGGDLEPYAPGKCIGGSRFGNYEGILPAKEGRSYTECDIDTLGKSRRGAKRIVFSNDGLIYYTEDHYESFELLYGEE